MAETTTTRPARTRAARSTTAKPAKAAAPKAATPKAEATEDTRPRLGPVTYVHDGDTKSYAKFKAPADMAGVCVGTIYAPLGTEEVKVLLIGAAE